MQVKPIEGLSNKAFKEAAIKFDDLPSYAEKVSFLFSIDAYPKLIFAPLKRTINKKA